MIYSYIHSSLIDSMTHSFIVSSCIHSFILLLIHSFNHRLLSLQDRPWGKGTPEDAMDCRKCECNGLSQRCNFDADLFAKTGRGGRCLDCQKNTEGKRFRSVEFYFTLEILFLSQLELWARACDRCKGILCWGLHKTFPPQRKES